METALPTIAIIGGTGALGVALARRLAGGGYSVIVGSRDVDRARAVAATLSAQAGRSVGADRNAAAASAADIVILTVPYAAHSGAIQEIRAFVAGKLVVDTTVPLTPRVMRVQLPEEGSAAVAAQRILGTRVVSAFHNVAAQKLAAADLIDCDVLVFGDAAEDRETVIRLVEACGLRGLHGGALANSAAAEALTSVLIFINRAYAVNGAGIRITGELRPNRPRSREGS